MSRLKVTPISPASVANLTTCVLSMPNARSSSNVLYYGMNTFTFTIHRSAQRLKHFHLLHLLKPRTFTTPPSAAVVHVRMFFVALRAFAVARVMAATHHILHRVSHFKCQLIKIQSSQAFFTVRRDLEHFSHRFTGALAPTPQLCSLCLGGGGGGGAYTFAYTLTATL